MKAIWLFGEQSSAALCSRKQVGDGYRAVASSGRKSRFHHLNIVFHQTIQRVHSFRRPCNSEQRRRRNKRKDHQADVRDTTELRIPFRVNHTATGQFAKQHFLHRLSDVQKTFPPADVECLMAACASPERSNAEIAAFPIPIVGFHNIEQIALCAPATNCCIFFIGANVLLSMVSNSPSLLPK